jgi:hypothetical protein
MVVLVIGALGALRYWAKELTQFTFVPVVPFFGAGHARHAWRNPAQWIARGPVAGRSARWLPRRAGVSGTLPARSSSSIPPAISTDCWNAGKTTAGGAGRNLHARSGQPFNAAAQSGRRAIVRPRWAPS